MNTKEHYDQHLHSYYSWIYGGFENKLEENRTFFKNNNIKPESTKVAVDLGAGSGFQSIPLAELGFKVKAIDFCRKLLDELESKKNDLDIEIFEDDMIDFSVYSKYNPELIICMGDTVTHLDNLNSLDDLIVNSYNILARNGKLIMTFRDLTYELKDEKRFISVRSDDDKIFTCFLEYYPEYLKVFDIVNEKENGKWIQKISHYKKIKIPEEKIKTIYKAAGFEIELLENKNGQITIIGVK